MILIIGTVLVIGYDIMAYLKGGVGSTISRVEIGWGTRYPELFFAIGYLMGHLTWAQPAPKVDNSK